MSKQPINTLKQWFISKAKPLSVQFWHWMDSYWHKDEQIPAGSIDGLQQLLEEKVTDAPLENGPFVRQAGDWVEASAVPHETDIIIPVDPLSESVSEIAATQSQINKENKTAIFAIRDSIRRLAGAAVTINHDVTPQLIGVAETNFDFVTSFVSTNEEVITTDDANNTITLKVDARYQFATYIVFTNPSAANAANITVRTRFTDNNAINTERVIVVPKNTTYIAPITAVPFDLTGAPRSIKITFQSDIIGVSIVQLETTLTTLAGTTASGGGTGLPSSWETDNAALRLVTDYQDGNDVGVYASGAIYEFSAVLTNADDNDTYITPADIVEPAPGRWVKRKTFITTSLYDMGFFLSDNDTPVTLDNRSHQYAERKQVIKAIALTADGAPGVSSLSVSVKKNNISILSSDITLVAGVNRVLITAPQITDTSINVGDKMSGQVSLIPFSGGTGVAITFITELI